MHQTNVEQLVQKWSEIPTIDQTGPKEGINGSVMHRIHNRTRIVYACMVLIGICLNALNWCGISVQAKICAFGMGLIVPGGGLIALGTWWSILLGIFCAYLWYKIGFRILDMFGGIVAVVGIWLIGALPSIFIDIHPHWSLTVLSLLTAVILFSIFEYKVHVFYKRLRKKRKENIDNFNNLLNDYEQYSKSTLLSEDERELDEEGLRAVRYIFDKTVRENGDYEGFDDKLLFSSLAAFRYQFSSLGYVLLLLQCKYMPNFRGYLSQAMQFCIDGFTDPRTCSYWRWESLMGYFKYHCNPIDDSNIMLSGWMLPVVTGYGANTHDRSFEQPGSLKFRVNKKKIYPYNVKETVECLHKQWINHKFPAYLIPCEPNIAFPICNAYGLLGLLIYDRDHGTKYSEDVLDEFYKNLISEFCEIDGSIAPRRQYLFGLRFMPPTQLIDMPINDMSLAIEYAPIFPGLAKRCYMLARERALKIGDDGLAYMKGAEWSSIVDMGTKAKNPGMVLGMLEMAAVEHGDLEMLAALRKTEARYLEKSKDPKILKYRNVSVVSMSNLIYSCIARKGDWHDTILKGPGETAFSGPVLESCDYPDVLVAKAISHGDDLSLVLYNGCQPGIQTLELANLQPTKTYSIQGSGETVVADVAGKAKLKVMLDGRTEIRICLA